MVKNNTNKITRAEIVYYRLLMLFAFFAAEIFGIIFASQTAERDDVLRNYIAPAIILVFGGLGIVFLCLHIKRIFKGVNELLKTFSSGFVSCVALWISSVFSCYFFFSEKRLIAYIVVSAALFFIFYLFDREFFTFSIFTAIGAALLSILNFATTIQRYVIIALIAVLCVALVVITVVAKNKKVSFKIGNSEFVIFDKTYKPAPFYISAGIILAGVLLSILLFDSLIYSLMLLFAYYLVFTVIKTIKMM